METKRCIYVDDDKRAQTGIYCSNGDGNDFIICECCGSIVDPSEVQYKVFENWVDPTSQDMDDLQDKTEEQLADLRQIEGLTQLYLEKYGQMEFVFPHQKVMATSTDYIEFNPIWD